MSFSLETAIQQEHTDDLLPDHPLIRAWNGARDSEAHAQAQWEIGEGGVWRWQPEGVCATGSGWDWSGLYWRAPGPLALEGLKNFVIEVTLSGKAELAGLSFGPYKDFLVPLDPSMGTRRLMLEVDAVAGCWALRVDGQLMNRCWWDSAVRSTEDLVNGVVTFKGRRIEEALFHNLAIHVLQASCQLSVIMTCYRFLQRLRVTLRNWCHQSLPSGAYEVLVVNPNSPDGTHEHLASVARSYPHVRVREIAVDSRLATNKGAMINAALGASRGKWIWLTDVDCLFSPNGAAAALDQIKGRSRRLFYGQRRFLTSGQTDALLAGRIDGLHAFDALAANANLREPENAAWGYTQIVERSTLDGVRYREHLMHFAHSDEIFVQDCKKRRIPSEQLAGLFCVHLDHPFAWYGTSLFL